MSRSAVLVVCMLVICTPAFASMTWSSCSSSSALCPVTKVTMSPDPAVRGQNVTFSVTCNGHGPAVTGGTSTNVVYLFGIKVLSVTKELCSLTTCPIEPGVQTVTGVRPPACGFCLPYLTCTASPCCRVWLCPLSHPRSVLVVCAWGDRPHAMLALKRERFCVFFGHAGGAAQDGDDQHGPNWRPAQLCGCKLRSRCFYVANQNNSTCGCLASVSPTSLSVAGRQRLCVSSRKLAGCLKQLDDVDQLLETYKRQTEIEAGSDKWKPENDGAGAAIDASSVSSPLTTPCALALTWHAAGTRQRSHLR